MRVTNNLNQPKTNKQSFEKAHVILKEERLLWDTAAQYGYKEKYVVPLKKMWKEMKKTPALREALRKAPRDVEVDFTVTNYSPGAFKIGISKAKDKEYRYSCVVAPTDMPENFKQKAIFSLTDAIKSISRKRV